MRNEIEKFFPTERNETLIFLKHNYKTEMTRNGFDQKYLSRFAEFLTMAKVKSTSINRKLKQYGKSHF